MADYTQMSLDDQLTMLEQENKNTRLLWAKAQMWANAAGELVQSGEIFEKETDKIETGWTDPAGQAFVERARNTRSLMATWTHNIQTAKPDRHLLDIGMLIPQALDLAQKNKEQFEAYWAALSKQYAMDMTPVAGRQSRADVEASFREPSGKLMNQLADLYRQAGDAVTQASAGGNYEGVNTVPKPKLGNPGVNGGGGAVGGGGPVGGGPTGAVTSPLGDAPNARIDGGTVPLGPDGQPLTGPNGQPLTGPNGQVTSPTGLTNPTGGGGPADIAPLETDPQLSGGLGGAPVTAPTLSGAPTGGGPTGGGVGGAPTPVVTSPIGGGGGGGTTGNRPIGGGSTGPIGGGPGGGGPTPIVASPITSTGGVRVPGVSGPLGGGGAGGFGPVGGGGIGSVGGGGLGGFGPVSGGGAGSAASSIPAAGTPFQAPASAAPGTAAPGVPPTSAGGAPSSGAGAGGMPMMPPMGGMGGMGGGSGPGSGAAARPTSNNKNRRKEVVTPGLPMMLSGKAGQADMNAFTGRGRKRAEESDVPTTVQLIDEDLWQVEQKPPAEERVVRPAL